MPLEKQTFPPNIRPLIEDLQNVIVVKDNLVLQNTLSSDQLSIQFTPYEKANVNGFKNDDPVVKENLKNLEETLKIVIHKNQSIETPINLFIIANDKALVAHTAIEVQENASAQIREYIYTDSGQTINYLSQTNVLKNASLNYIAIANLDKTSVSAINRQALVEANAKLYMKTAQLGDGKTSQKADVDLIGPFAYGDIKTVAVSSDTQEVVIHSNVEHMAKNTEGLIEHYGVAADESFLVFEGTGKIHKGMKQSMAHQHNNGVVLGNHARLDANPLLLIDEYDVEASHGAAIGRIDEEQLYYLMSRGLSEKDAQRLIINGFLAPLKDLMDNEKLKDYIQNLLENKTR